MKKLYLIFVITISFSSLSARDLDSTSLIIIDIQDFYFPGGAVELHEPVVTAQQAEKLLEYFRENNGLIVHVRHNFEPGGSIHKTVKPLDSEKVVSKNEVSAFLNTGLNKYLKENNISNLVLCGMQTHMCLEAATLAGHDLGYKCIVIEDACTTKDLSYEGVVIKAKDVHYSTLSTLKSYSKVVNLNSFISENRP